jgi:hypothetical protein
VLATEFVGSWIARLAKRDAATGESAWSAFERRCGPDAVSGWHLATMPLPEGRPTLLFAAYELA